MASRRRRPNSSVEVQRRGVGSMRRIISSDIMGNRNVEVVPVGAWVEPANDDFQPDVVRAAQVEEEKIHRMKGEKENKLRSFQQQTRHRVNEANHLRRQQQIQEAEQAFELERKVVQQSCLTGDVQRKDTCVIRKDLDLAIRKRLLEKYGEDVETWRKDTTAVLKSHTEESHQVTDKARRQLLSRKIVQNTSDDNPFTNGWSATTTQDVQIPAVRSVVDVGGLPTTYKTSHKQADINEDTNERDAGKFMGQGPLQKSKPLFNDRFENERNGEDGKENSGADGERRLHFENQNLTDQAKKNKKRQRSSNRPRSAQLADILLRDSEGDVLARQRRQQAAVSRKIFMDREREAVRENIRRQHHRQKIIILKKEKEIYRHELEEIARRKLEPTDAVTGETAEELRLREKMEALQMKDFIDVQQNELRKTTEMKRYLNALRHTLMEKVTRQGLQLPSLCACGTTVWDTHPDTCANNCFFYKNPRAYARALQSLHLSADVIR